MALTNRKTVRQQINNDNAVTGVGYPIVKARDLEGLKPTSAPSSLVLDIENTTSTTKIVPLFNLYHQNDEANQAIKDAYEAQETEKGGTPYTASSMAEVIKNYDPERPVQGVFVTPSNQKPLAGIYEELKSMPVLVNGFKLTSDNVSQFNEKIRLDFSDWDGSNQSAPRSISHNKDRHANDNTELNVPDVKFFLDGRGTLFLPVQANTKVLVEFFTSYHFNRLML